MFGSLLLKFGDKRGPENIFKNQSFPLLLAIFFTQHRVFLMSCPLEYSSPFTVFAGATSCRSLFLSAKLLGYSPKFEISPLNYVVFSLF